MDHGICHHFYLLEQKDKKLRMKTHHLIKINIYEASKVIDKVNFHVLMYMFYSCACMSVYRFFSL